ncbi:MAG TPA: FtsX-like permease family protein [Ktedonobacterales bacterium]|nr:FtsX-like permease family protein [Ktedonobacterales bacterium]
MKLVMYWRYATRSLARGGQRSVFAVFCVAVGVLVIVALQLVGHMAEASITGNIRALNGGDIAVHTEYHDLTRLQLGYFDQLKAQGVITAYSPSGGACASADTPAGPNQRLCIDTVDPATFPLGGGLRWVVPASGGSLPTLLRGNQAVLTDGLAQQLHLGVGDVLSFTTDDGRSATLTISGIVATSGFLQGRPEMLVADATYTALPNLSGAPEGYTWVWVDVPGHSDADAARVADQIQRQFPLTTAHTVQQEQQLAHDEIAAIQNFLQVVGLLALLIGGVGIVNTMQVLLRRRLLEIAMLKTQGYRRRDLLLMFGIEAGLLGLGGGLLGAAGGIGMSFVVKALLDRALFLTVSTIIDPLIVAAGVLIGLATTLIFGLLPIVQTSAIRPLAVLRESQEPRGWHARLSTALLLLLLGFLFFVLAASILRNPLLAAGVVAGAGTLLILATFLFAGVAWLLSRLPVHDRPRWWDIPVLAVALAVAVVMLLASPAFGMPLLALVLCAALVALLPRSAKAGVRLALRNIGRARLRSASTLVALFAGVFAIGLGFALGQGLKDTFTQLAASGPQASAYVLATSADAPIVRQHLAGAPGLSGQQVNLAAPDRILAVNGVPLAQLLPAGSGDATSQLGQTVSGVEGYDLAAGQLPQVTLEQGTRDNAKGRTLTAADATTGNALFPPNYSQPPLNLKLGDTLTVAALNGTATVTLRVSGFYSAPVISALEPVLADVHVVHAISDEPLYDFALHLDPTYESQVLGGIKQAAPDAITIGIGSLLQQLNSILDNVVELIESVAALALLAGLIMIANTVALAMLERRRELGILKAVGYTSRGVLGTVLVENGVLAITSALLAMLLVTGVSLALGTLIFNRYTSSGIPLVQVLGLVLGTAAICVLVAGAVAWSATRVRPLAVLRYE